MPQFHLAQLNIAQMKYDINQPEMAEFVENLDTINALAEQAPGFVWRLKTEQGDATDIDFFGSDILVNMSVWQDVKSLHDYVYRSMHNQIMSKRKQWFDRIETVYSVLWWIPIEHFPTLEEARQRLQSLQQLGPTEQAFTFKSQFPAPGEKV